MVISDSMAGRVNIHQIKRNIDTSEEAIIFKRFPGAMADDMRHYSTKPLQEVKPNQVIIIAGTNDIQRDVHPGSTINEYQIVEDLMAIAREVGEKSAHRRYMSRQ